MAVQSESTLFTKIKISGKKLTGPGSSGGVVLMHSVRRERLSDKTKLGKSAHPLKFKLQQIYFKLGEKAV